MPTVPSDQSGSENRATAIDQHMMQRALEQAKRGAEAGEVPVGAVVYRGSDVLAQAHNLREVNADPCAHAEILALRQAAQRIGSWRLVDCAIAVTLEPCPMCAGAIINARIDRLVYGATDPKMGSVDTLYQLCRDQRFNHQPQVIGGVLDLACGEILTAFFRQRRA